MSVARARAPRVVLGSATPRIAPPVPARSAVAHFREVAANMGITLYPWQETAARYLTATGPSGHLYREVAIVVARQNGKTELMKPLIVDRLRAGCRILHIAQTRELPRQMFRLIASTVPEAELLRERGRGGKMHTVWPRGGSGQEEILMANGGSYRIAAASTGGARGQSTDLLIIDETREMETDDVIAAAEPTLLASDDPQTVYLSNAGSDASIVLNAIRDRAGKDPNLAYLEWSAAPIRAIDDREGWIEANPSVGHKPTMMQRLEEGYLRHSLAGTLSTFKTENLCQWVDSMRQTLVAPAAWRLCEADEPLARGRARTFLGVSMAPEGTRASAVVSWQQDDGSIALRQVLDVTGHPIDAAAFGETVRDLVKRLRVRKVGYDPMTDAEAVKYAKTSERISGQLFANASSRFVHLVDSNRLVWDEADAVTDDLTWTARKETDETGTFVAVRSNDDRPVTAALASIRAAWLASGPRPVRPKVM